MNELEPPEYILNDPQCGNLFERMFPSTSSRH